MSLFNKENEAGLYDFYIDEIHREISRQLVKDQAQFFLSKNEYHKFCIQQSQPNGLFLEFGVFQGQSISLFAEEKPEIQFYGFDSFEGLPPSTGVWEKYFKSGHFDLKGELPEVPKNVELIKGWFDKTVPDFISKHQEPVSFLHIDSDIYLSAKIILENFKARLQPGAVILFDELCNYNGFEEHEYKAFNEELINSGLKFQWIAFSLKEKKYGTYAKVALKVLENPLY